MENIKNIFGTFADKIKRYCENCSETVKRELKIFAEYLKKNYLFITVSCAIFLVVFSSWLSNTNPRIDSENFINEANSDFNWLEIGREFAIFTKYLFGIHWFNPALATTLGYLMICLAGIVFGYLFWRCTRRSGWACAAFLLPFFIAPIFAEQFYFDLQIFEMAWAFLLCAAGAGLGLYGAFRRSYTALFLFAVAALWAVGTYQAFAVLITAIILFCFALVYRRWATVEGRSVSAKEYGVAFGKTVGFFAAAVILYIAITLIWFSGSSYTTSNFYWLTSSFSECLQSICTHIRQGFAGEGIFYTWFYTVFAILSVGAAVLDAVQSKTKFSIFYVVFVVLLQFSPFLLTVVFGGINPFRTQYTYPFVLAANMLFLVSRDWKIKKLFGANFGFIFIALAAISLFSQINMTARLIYTNNIRAQEDTRLAAAIEEEIARVSSTDKPIAFIGYYSNRLNNSCIKGELIGYSLFDIHHALSPYYFWSTRSVCNLMRTISFPFTSASEEQVYEARIYARDNDMPCWPSEGSVYDKGDYTIVKLSEDEFTFDLPAQENTI